MTRRLSTTIPAHLSKDEAFDFAQQLVTQLPESERPDVWRVMRLGNHLVEVAEHHRQQTRCTCLSLRVQVPWP